VFSGRVLPRTPVPAEADTSRRCTLAATMQDNVSLSASEYGYSEAGAVAVPAVVAVAWSAGPAAPDGSAPRAPLNALCRRGACVAGRAGVDFGAAEAGANRWAVCLMGADLNLYKAILQHIVAR
jgi:hypothetical protein